MNYEAKDCGCRQLGEKTRIMCEKHYMKERNERLRRRQQ